jgi:hypothetical protein
VEAREGHVPDSIEEVRDRVVADLRLVDGYETALARAESLRSCAAGMSLEEAFESDAELMSLKDTEEGAGLGYFEPPPFGRASQYQAARGRLPEEMWVGGGIGQLPADAIEECFALAESDEEDMSKVIELSKRATVMVVGWAEVQPGHADDFLDTRVSLVDQMSRYRTQDAIAEWMDPEQIRARNGFEIARP